jgi:glycosyltransferase involved in cell wall biosynthesis
VEVAEHLMNPDTGVYREFEEFCGRRFLFAAGHFDYFSGAEKQAVYFAAELVKHLQADVKFIGWGGNGRFADEIRKVGAVPVVFPLDPGGTGWSHRLQLLRLARFIRRELQPEFLLPYVWMHCRIVGAIWNWTGAKFCWWNQRDEGREIFGTRLEWRLMQTLPAVVSNSWDGRDFLTRKFNLQPGRVQVINNGVRIPEKSDRGRFRKNLGIPDRAVVLAMAANLTRYKDHATLVRAFAAAHRLNPHCELHLVLAGSHEEATVELKALAWDLGLHGVLHLPGSVVDMGALFESVDLVVHSSRTEGCPNGALEAMAHGRCVIGTDISGMRQAIGEENSALCLAPPGDSRTLAGIINRFSEDLQMRERIGEANRQRILSEFSVNQMALNCLRVIRSAVVF